MCVNHIQANESKLFFEIHFNFIIIATNNMHEWLHINFFAFNIHQIFGSNFFLQKTTF